MSTVLSTRGRVWFEALAGTPQAKPKTKSDPASVLFMDAPLGDSLARFLCVVPDADARFSRAREGEVGVEEAYTLATKVREVINGHESGLRKPIIAIVDVRSQAYGRREETVAIHLAAAVAADAYATARRLGHPVIALVVGQALSGGFLTHGYQANRILALDDPGVIIHAMHKEAAARITRRTVDELDKLAESVVPLSYSIRDFAKLGILHQLLAVKDADHPDATDTASVRAHLIAAVEDARQGARDLSCRWLSSEAATMRRSTLKTREAMFSQWSS